MLQTLALCSLIFFVLGAKDFPCERKQNSRRIGKYYGTKVDRTSKFVFIDRPASENFSFFDAEKGK